MLDKMAPIGSFLAFERSFEQNNGANCFCLIIAMYIQLMITACSLTSFHNFSQMLLNRKISIRSIYNNVSKIK